MKNALIVHNPSAGDGIAEKDELIRMLEISGFSADYVSTDADGWKNFSLENRDVLVVAGGDGTVRKLAKTLLKKHKPHSGVPIAVVPMGTANNIAKTLRSDENSVTFLSLEKYRDYDRGKIKGLEHDFFMESAGFGIFPALITFMKDNEVKNENRKEKIKRAQESLQKLVRDFKPFKATIKTGNTKITDSFLLVEVMNIQSLGPNLILAPDADSGDGLFDLVMIRVDERELLQNYVSALIDKDDDAQRHLDRIARRKVKKVKIKVSAVPAHVDDELIKKVDGKKCKIKIDPGRFKFMYFD